MSTKFSLFLILIIIVFLSAVNLQRLERFEQNVSEKGFIKIEIPEIKPLDLDGLRPEDLKDFELEGFIIPSEPMTLEQLKKGHKTFTSPNETLKIKYPANWQAIDKTLLEKFIQETKKYKPKGSELLFFAHQIRLAQHPPLLIIQKLPPEKGLKEIIEGMKTLAEKKQIELTIIKSETKNGIDYFKAKYKKENYYFYLKGRVASVKERNYLITVFVLDQLLEEVASQINFIFDSIEIIQ